MRVPEFPARVVARIRSDFPTKFGVPRQSGLVPELTARIVFEPGYRNRAALTGIEGFSHLWLLWDFSLSHREEWSPTVRPPRLGGDKRMGVFATRSPFRPSPIGLSCVRLLGVEEDAALGTVLVVGGADLVDGTPILDIKPYLPSDAHPEATGGFTDQAPLPRLTIEDPEGHLSQFDAEVLDPLRGVLALDPRPAYLAGNSRVFGVPFAGHDVRFTVEGDVLTVVDVVPLAPGDVAPTGHETPPDPLDLLDWPRQTERLTLRRPVTADAAAIHAYRSLPEVDDLLSGQPGDLETFVAEFPEWRRTQILVEHRGEIVGDLMLRVQDAWSQAEVTEQARGTQAELGWVFDPRWHGRGFATEAVTELLAIAFDGVGVRRVEAGCFAQNTASRRVMEKVGLRLEGVYRGESLHRDGTWRDGATYALLASEWRSGKATPPEHESGSTGA